MNEKRELRGEGMAGVILQELVAFSPPKQENSLPTSRILLYL